MSVTVAQAVSSLPAWVTLSNISYLLLEGEACCCWKFSGGGGIWAWGWGGGQVYWKPVVGKILEREAVLVQHGIFSFGVAGSA